LLPLLLVSASPHGMITRGGMRKRELPIGPIAWGNNNMG
jgi:hypothetical protein